MSPNLDSSPSPIRSEAGLSLLEVMAASAVVGLVLIMASKTLTQTSTTMVRTTLSLNSEASVRRAMTVLERDFQNMGFIEGVAVDSITFRMDRFQSPYYNAQGDDPDNDGISNRVDPDDDNDAGVVPPTPAQAWKYEYDLRDDDDDNDGKVDVVCQYFVNNGKLHRKIVVNESSNLTTETILLEGVLPGLFRLECYGAKNIMGGELLDKGNDGLPNTADTGENDSIISEREIDWVLSAQGGVGNQNGAIDTDGEISYVSSFKVTLAQDMNGDGVKDFYLKNMISPSPLAIRRNH